MTVENPEEWVQIQSTHDNSTGTCHRDAVDLWTARGWKVIGSVGADGPVAPQAVAVAKARAARKTTTRKAAPKKAAAVPAEPEK